MKLPNAHLAVVEERKVVDYLLNAAHPDNGGKAPAGKVGLDSRSRPGSTAIGNGVPARLEWQKVLL